MEQHSTSSFPRPPDRMKRWRSATELPLVFAALVFIGAYAWPAVDPDLPPHLLELCGVLIAVVWVVFAVDYAVRLYLSPDRWTFVRENLLDLLIVVLPVLRPLHLVRLLTVVSLLHRHMSVSLRGHVLLYTAGITVVMLVMASVSVLRAEQGAPDANITTLADAFWWSLVTVSTVGYGDLYPVTGTGRLIAAFLFVMGIGLLGVITGTLSTWLVQRVDDSKETRERSFDEDTARQLRELTEQVRELRAELGRAAAPSESAPSESGRADP
ncbi:potassium channel family protein [Nocardiopsis dassonvillei]|uniref:potassium channel family protein n=1 Tax=Nocardiopsis dassonvillei TaxID=2014 RepID=UPI0010D9D4F8|nr:potassium channel family protein [Nocardiopsis dassonvillei]MCP3012479.1 potassium channel family protein [Nocardiopsis dassonvillei]